ncbi:MAG TPA: DinB family protein [Gemmatimonadaceae bacterium]|nr:DinB family protein [Gemmatimonadaceae bacterium]
MRITSLSELIAYLDEQAAVIRAAYESVSVDQRMSRPASDRWSPAEVVHHVSIVNRAVARLLHRLVDQARTLPRHGHAMPAIENEDIARILDRSRRFVASESAQPRDTDPARLWPDFDASVRELQELIAASEGLPLESVSAHHAALGNLTGYEWIAFIGAHAARHAAQIREIAGT